MRDPFDAQTYVDHTGRQYTSKLSSPDAMPSSYMHGNGEGGVRTPTYDPSIRQSQKVSVARNLRGDEFNNHFLDPEITELYSRSQAQEEEIVQLRRQISDAFIKELQLLSEKHILERKLSDLRMAFDEKQDDTISNASKELLQRKSYLEENLKLTNDLRVTEEEVYIFTSSLLSVLAEYNIHPPVINASTITTGSKHLYQHLQRKVRSSDAADFDDLNHRLGYQPGTVITNDNRQLPSSSKSQFSQPYMDSNMNSIHQYNQYPADQLVESAPNQSSYIRDYDMTNLKVVGGTNAPHFVEDSTIEATNRRVTIDTQFNFPTTHETQASSMSEGDASLPGIEGFQIIGDAKPGCTLRACGFPTSGTSLCIFQWVRHLQDGTRQSIEGATVPDYVVTADDVDTLLAVDCIPMDDSGRQGVLVRLFANNESKITCDSETQHEIETHTSRGRAQFNVLLWIDSSEDWEVAILILKRSSYQIKVSRTDVVVIEENYSADLYIRVPYGLTTQFVLISSDGTSLHINTDGTSQPHSMDNDIRLRDIIVLTMRIFQSKALDGKRKGKA